tara:strand:+ start:227133 stop:230594 length:3462 start_codon:yes stop_codon:yes gene_type:complete
MSVKTKMKAMCLLAGMASGFAGASEIGTHPGLIQYPSLSPDGKTVVFSAAGDLWAINSGGGVATRLTAHPAIEGRAKFDADGSRLAFESNRGGADNIYLAQVSGNGNSMSLSNIDRVTTSDRAQWLGGFSADGQSVMFSAYLYPEIYRQPKMYSAPIDGGAVTELTSAFGRAPTLSNADDSIYFIRGYYYPHRVAYRGSGNLDIWKLSSSDGEFTQMTGFDGNDMDPCPLPDGSMLYISSKDGQYNLYRMNANKSDEKGRNSGKQLTSFAPTGQEQTIMGGVRDLTVSQDGSLAAFVVVNTLYTLDLNDRNAQPVAVDFTMGTDTDRDSLKGMDVARKVSESVMHPSGKAIAVVARNELFVRSTEEEYPSRRITDTPVRERDIAWSPDGEVLYFTADDDESMGSIYTARVSLSSEDLKPEEVEEPEKVDEENAEDETAAESDVSDEDSGDSEAKDSEGSDEEDGDDEAEPEKEAIDHAARWAGALRFEITPVVAGEPLAYRPTPSPDGKKLMYLRDRGDVVIMDIESGTTRVILESWSGPEVLWASDSVHVVYSDSDLNFNADIYLLDTRVGEDGSTSKPINLTRHPDLDHSPQLSADGKVLTFLSDRGGNNWEWDVYAINLDRSLDGMRKYELDAYYKGAVKAVKKLEPLDVNDPVEIEPFEFDTSDAYMRVRRLTSTPESENNLAMSPAGDRIAFSADGAFVSVDQYGKERKTIQSGSVSDARVSIDGKTVSFINGGVAKSAGMTGGDVTTYDIDGSIQVDTMAELAQKFEETASAFGMSFYHPTLKGLDWDGITEQYRTLAMQTRTNEAFQRVMALMFGEVNGSHTGIWGGDGFSAPSPANGYLGIDTTPVSNGYRVDRVYTQGSVDRMNDGIQVGDVIVAIGEKRLDDPSRNDLHASMAGMSNVEVLVEYLSSDAETGETVTKYGMVTPQSYGSNSVVRYSQEVIDRQTEVDELSEGKLGYLHIRSMGEASVRDFERDLFAAAEGKDGLIIDVRDNGGGWTTDILLASLTAPTHAYTIPRGANPDDVRPDSYPRDRRLIYPYSRPIVVLINENSFSNAEIFAHSIRTAKRGRLIGTTTFGGVISTGSFSLIDGTTVRRPFRGWYLPDGTDMDNNGAEPDVVVKQTPTDEAAGEDPQLEAAVKDLLKTIK